jgi:hypothetical protein
MTFCLVGKPRLSQDQVHPNLPAKIQSNVIPSSRRVVSQVVFYLEAFVSIILTSSMCATYLVHIIQLHLIAHNNIRWTIRIIKLFIISIIPHVFSPSSCKDKVVSVFNQLSTTLWRSIGEWRCSFIILDLGTRLRRMVSFTCRPLYRHGKSLRHSLHRKLGKPQSWLGQCEDDKNPPPLSGIEYRPSSR